MPKYRVYGLISASIVVGEYEAETEEKALEMAEDDKEATWHANLCHHCAGEVDLGGDVYETECEEID